VPHSLRSYEWVARGLTIQLHRWQLRLQTLGERKAQLEKELGGKNL